MVWETDRVFKTPESALYDEERDQIYVSNVNGKPTDKDNNGFISILNTDGSIKELKWITGMHAPKGMAYNDSLLYVTDIDRIMVIDIDKGEIIKIVDVEGASFLNDMAVIHSNQVVISDMGENKLMVYDGHRVSVYLDDDLLVSPNGLAATKIALFIGTKEHLLKIDMKENKLKKNIEGVGPIDGLVPLGLGKFVVSDWSGRILLIDAQNKIVLQNTADKNIQAADLGYIPKDKIILIPTFFDNRVVARKLP